MTTATQSLAAAASPSPSPSPSWWLQHPGAGTEAKKKKKKRRLQSSSFAVAVPVPVPVGCRHRIKKIVPFSLLHPVAATPSSSSSSYNNWNWNWNWNPRRGRHRSLLFSAPDPSPSASPFVRGGAGEEDGNHHPLVSYHDDDLTPISSPSDEKEKKKKDGDLIGVAYLGVLFALWYLFNVYFNIFNKQVLKAYPFPLTISAFQFATGTLVVVLMWTSNLYQRPKISSSQLMAIMPLAVVHTLGNLFTNMSLGSVAVSFTHTIKAMEPFFSVVLSALFLGEFPTIWVLSSLVPIVGGVALASVTEVSFNWSGFWSAMASNLTYQSRNVLSKQIMVNKEESMDNITLFSIITIMSFFLSVPVALFVEGVNFTPSYIKAAGLNLREVLTRSFIAALCYHAYQQVAYMILAKVSPISHSVGNCVKRVVVIVSSVLFFRTPVSPINSLGTGVALAGVFMYSRVKDIKAKAS